MLRSCKSSAHYQPLQGYMNLKASLPDAIGVISLLYLERTSHDTSLSKKQRGHVSQASKPACKRHVRPALTKDRGLPESRSRSHRVGCIGHDQAVVGHWVVEPFLHLGDAGGVEIEGLLA
jgi:hypothetical protein